MIKMSISSSNKTVGIVLFLKCVLSSVNADFLL